MKKDDSAILAETLTRFSQHMPRGDDLTLIVLKGHLLLEEEINALLKDRVTDITPLLKARLTFAQRLALLMSLLHPEVVDALKLSAASKLNSLRNELAHNLSSSKVEERASRFLRQVEATEDLKALQEYSRAHRLRLGIATLCAKIAAQRAVAASVALPPRPNSNS